MGRGFGLLCALPAIVCLGPVAGQEVSAGHDRRVAGRREVVIGATVMARDLDRSTSWPATSNEDGIYSFPRFPSGLTA